MAILPVGNISRMPGGRLGRRIHELVDCTYAGVVSQVGVAIGEPFEGIGVKAVAGIGGKAVRRRRGSCGAAGFLA